MSVIGFVGDDTGSGEAGDQGERMSGIAGLPWGQQEADRTAERVDGNMPLAGQPSSGTPQSLVLDPPFWPVAAWA